MNIVERKINATGKNLVTFSFSNDSHSILPAAAKALTTRAVPMSWENRMKEGAATL